VDRRRRRASAWRCAGHALVPIVISLMAFAMLAAAIVITTPRAACSTVKPSFSAAGASAASAASASRNDAACKVAVTKHSEQEGSVG